ncbi:MAG: tetratricopeptide repeat protein [Anderseniella sp.]
MMKVTTKFAIAAGAVVLSGLLPAASWAQTIDNDPVIEAPQDAVDSPPTFKEKLKIAGEGDIDIQISLAKDYLSGDNDTPIRPVDAARWLTKASEKGNAEAQFLLANLLRKGAKGLKSNKKNAVTLYASAADKGHAEAAYWAADAYHYGKGVKKAEIKAIGYYEKAADLGHVASKNNLGLMYLQGKGVDRDLQTAFRLFNDTSKSGNSWGQNNLGGMYEMGWGTVQDTAKALQLYQRSAAAGNIHGASNMVRLRAVLEVAATAEPAEQETTNTPNNASDTAPAVEETPDPDVSNQPAETQILGGSSTD